jgi:RimJ/RimL family protein N-acetyltransferase
VTPPDRTLSEFWPIFGLRLATPRLILTPLQDDDLVETLDLILGGIHESTRMPFKLPWTDAPRDELIPNSLRYYWTSRAASTPDAWSLPFMVRRSGVLVGMQELQAKNFAVTRSVGTGSWLGAAHQGSGIGTEMREAVLQFAFDHLKAQRADSEAFTDNPQSLRVSEKLGYRHDGTAVLQRRPGERAVEQRLTLAPGEFRRSNWAVQVRGLPLCRSYFGL